MSSASNSLAILFADISGSTRLYETLGDQAALKQIGSCLGELERITRRHAGEVVKTIGDEILCAFPDAASAVEAAMAMQQALLDESGPLHIRVGLHFGEVIREGGDVFGDAVNLAARLTVLAAADQVITSRATADNLPSHLRANIRQLGQTMVKGKRDAVEICEVVWNNDAEMTLMPTMLPGVAARTVRIGITLNHSGRKLTLSGQQPVANVGREKDNDLVVDDPMASRRHARIELRNGKFVLVDQSTNGTYVVQGGKTFFLHREELPLAGSGYFTLGHKAPANVPEAVHYSCE
ncbi:MAG: FHA domain-containing protein [Sulfuricella sp.]|nr:FHA domain-containing protein [Sulfuricella sp.]